MYFEEPDENQTYDSVLSHNSFHHAAMGMSTANMDKQNTTSSAQLCQQDTYDGKLTEEGGSSSGLPVLHLVKKKSKYDDRNWTRDYHKWQEGLRDKPGPHPDPEHWWNLKPELHDID